MIVHTTFGLFRFASSLTLFPPLPIFLLTSARSLAPPLRASSATTAVNSIIPWPARSSSLMVLHSACRAPTRHSKTARPNARFAPLTTSCVLCYFRQAFLRSTGLRHFTPPHIWSTGSPPKRSPPPPPHFFISTLLNHLMNTSKFLAVPAIPTCHPPHPTNLHLVHPYVSSSPTPQSTKVIGVSS